MKIKELIKKLKEFDPELEVVVDGYEGGCDYPRSIDKIEIKKNYHNGSYCGNHEEITDWDREPDNEYLKDFIDRGGIISNAVIIRR